MADRTKRSTKQKSSGHVLAGILGACLGALVCLLLTYLVGLVYVAGAVLFLLFLSWQAIAFAEDGKTKCSPME